MCPIPDESKMLQRIQELLAHYRENTDPLFFCLCQLADAWKVDPEYFRSLLVSKGLRPERASEVKSVLLCRKALKAFLTDPKTSSWNMTLATAQQKPPELERSAARLIRLVVKWGTYLHDQEDLDGHWKFTRDSAGNLEVNGPGGTLVLAKVVFAGSK